MADIGNLVVKIGTDLDDLEKGINKAKNLVSGAVDKLSGLGGVLSGVVKAGALAAAAGIAAVTAAVGALVVGLVSVGKYALEAFIPFQKNMNEVFSLLPDLSEKAQKQMSADALKLAEDLGVLPEEIIPAMYEALSAGVPQDNILEFMKISGKAAIAGATDQATAVDLLTSVTNAYGSDVIDAAKASDYLFQTIKLGKTTADELAGSLYNVLPVAASLGVGLDQVGAALAAMTAQGVPTSVATTQLRQLLNELSSAGSDAAATFEAAAGTSFPEFINAGGNLNEALKIMEKVAASSGVRLNDLFSSVEAGGAALVLNANNGQVFNDFLGQMGNSAGAMDAAFEIMNQGIGRTIEKIQTFGQTTLIQIGEKIAPTFQKLLDVVLEVMPQIQTSVLSLADQIIPILDNAIDQLVPTAQAAFGWIKDVGVPFLVSAFQSAAPKVQQFFSWFRETAIPWITEFSNRAGQILTTFFSKFDSNFGPSLDRIRESINKVAEALGFATEDASGMDTALSGLETILKGVATGFDLWSRYIESVARGAKTLIDILRSVYNAIRDIVNLVPNFFGGALFAASGGRTFQQLTGRAVGGPVLAGNPYIVGEMGPEVFVPNASGQIIPNGGLSGAFRTLAISNEYLDGLQRIDSSWGDIAQKTELVLKNQEAINKFAIPAAQTYTEIDTSFKSISASAQTTAIAAGPIARLPRGGWGGTFSSDFTGASTTNWGQKTNINKVVDTIEGMGRVFTSFNPKDYDFENQVGFLQNFASSGGLGRFNANSTLFEDGSFYGGQSANINNRTFNYSPTYHGVGSSNPEMDYYLMNSLAS